LESSARPALGGFREVTDFINNKTLAGSDILNPLEYARIVINKMHTENKTPLQVTKDLKNYSNEAITAANELRNIKGTSIEFKTLLDDIQAMAYLGAYYAEKIEAATALAFYQETKKMTYKEQAILHLKKATQHWILYATISEKNYNPQMLARTNVLDWSKLLENVKQDIALVKKM